MRRSTWKWGVAAEQATNGTIASVKTPAVIRMRRMRDSPDVDDWRARIGSLYQPHPRRRLAVACRTRQTGRHLPGPVVEPHAPAGKAGMARHHKRPPTARGGP